jgi:hypothetical protein
VQRDQELLDGRLIDRINLVFHRRDILSDIARTKNANIRKRKQADEKTVRLTRVRDRASDEVTLEWPEADGPGILEE